VRISAGLPIGGSVNSCGVPLRRCPMANAAATLVGHSRPYANVPWFWSDQYDIKLQMVGLLMQADSFALRGSVEARKFSLFHFHQGILVAIESVNAPGDHMIGRKLVTARLALTPEQVSDPGFDLKSAATA